MSKLACSYNVSILGNLHGLLKAPLTVLSWLFELLFAGSTNEHTGLSYSSRAVFGFVEKAGVKRVVHPSERFSMGSSGGDDGMICFLSEMKLFIRRTYCIWWFVLSFILPHNVAHVIQQSRHHELG